MDGQRLALANSFIQSVHHSLTHCDHDTLPVEEQWREEDPEDVISKGKEEEDSGHLEAGRGETEGMDKKAEKER